MLIISPNFSRTRGLIAKSMPNNTAENGERHREVP